LHNEVSHYSNNLITQAILYFETPHFLYLYSPSKNGI
jgi:hypothetical protein